MNQQQEDSFADKLVDIYRDIEPSLLALAHRYRAPNPQVTVKEWMSRAYEIVDRFDKGDLKAKVYVNPENQEDMEAYDPDVHKQERFLESLKNYLKHCFTNDILKNHNKLRRRRQTQDTVVEATTSSYSQVGFAADVRGLFKYDNICIDSIIKVITQDYDRSKSSDTCMLDVVHEHFLLALLRICKEIKGRGEGWENLVVVPDVDETDNKKFFSYDFRSELESGVRKELCTIIMEETNPILIRKLYKLIGKDKKSKAAIQKRLFRYLYEYRNGMPDRLRTRVRQKAL
jgi:hypothetical protein